MAQNETRAVGYLQLVRQNKAFRYLWAGQIVSLTGDWFNLIASASLIATLTQSGSAIGGLFAVRMLAPFLVSPFAGVVADRYNRKAIVIMTDILRALVVLGFVLVREPEQVWLIYLLTIIQSASQGFFFPAWNSLLPDITQPQELGVANAISAATWSVMLAFGAALGGLVSGIVGVYPAFIIDSLTFLLSASIVFRMPYRSTLAHSPDTSIMAGIRQYIQGINYLRRHFDTFTITLHKGMLGLLVIGFFQVAQVTIAERYFPIGEGGSISLGLIYVSTGIGSGISPLVGRHWAKDRNQRLRIMIACGYISALIGFLITATLASLPIVLLGGLLRGIGGGLVWVLGTQLLLQIVPNEVRGRVFSTEFAMYTLFAALSSAITGGLIDSSLGVTGIMLLGSALLLMPTLLWSIWIVLGSKRSPITADKAALS